MRVKTRGAIAPANAPLCQTCRHATIVRGPGLDNEIIECGALTYGHGRITFPVTYCTSYSDRRQASLRDMEEIAWVLRTDANRNQIGFVRASKLRERERFVLTEE